MSFNNSEGGGGFGGGRGGGGGGGRGSMWRECTMNGTFPWTNDWDMNSPHLDGSRHWTWSRFILPDTSYLVATCYLSFLCVLAVGMCIRSRTRLRAFACFLTYLGLTIAVVGLLRAKQFLGPNWFWAWNFSAEGIAVVALALTIVSVGTGFYPMAGRRSIYWKVAMAIIGLYALVSAAGVGFYAYHKLVLRPISGIEVEALRQAIIDEGIYRPVQLCFQRGTEFREGKIPAGNASMTGVESWRDLALAEKEMYARPESWAYLVHQLCMLGTMAWVCFYLFIPLVRNHRHGPVARPIDSDMMAVGVWYLSSLLTLAAFYSALNIYYCFKPEFIFEQQAQALDLCLRITIGPIFFLPAPKCLLRFYHEHFQKFKTSSGGGSAGRGVGSSGRNNITSSNHGEAGSFSYGGGGDLSLFSQSMQSRVESSYPRGSFDISRELKPMEDVSAASKHKSAQKRTSGTASAFGRLKLFQTRDRGLSVESSHVFNQDFENDRHSQSHSDDRPNSFHQDLHSMNHQHPLRDYMNASSTLGQIAARQSLQVAAASGLSANGQYHMKPIKSRSKCDYVPARSDLETIPIDSDIDLHKK